MPKNLVRTTILLAAGLGLAACNTLNGVGQDASAVGHDVSKGATSVQNQTTSQTGAAQH